MGLTPAIAYEATQAALVGGTELRPSTVLLGSRADPATILHRQFRLDPGNEVNTHAYRGQAGEAHRVTETMVLHLSHDWIASKSLACYRLASDDALAAIRAVTTRTEITARSIRAKYMRTSRRQVGNYIEQDIVVELTYDRDLPAAAP